MEAHPAWPVVALAAFQLGDAVTVAVNPPFIQAANNRVNTPPGSGGSCRW